MKNHLIAALLISAFPTFGQTPSSPNAILEGGMLSLPNAGFEMPDSTTGSGLESWMSQAAMRTMRDEQTRYAGKASLRLQAPVGQSYSAFVQWVPISPAPALRKFRVSGYLKRDSVEQFAGIWVNVFAGEQSLFFDNMQSRGLNGTADWVAISSEFYADETATGMQVGGLIVGKGIAWFDEFSLLEIPLQASSAPDSLRAYLTEAVDIIRENALYRDSVNWPKVREHVLLMTSGASSYADCYPAIRYALGKLGDHHSFLMPAATSQEWSEPSPDAYKRMPLTTGEILDGQYACLRMPSVNSGSEMANTYFANELHDQIERLDRYNPKGWILDLRGNSGGNCWPMLAGIGPVLGEGICGYFIEPGKTTSTAWFYKKGRSGAGLQTITKVSRKPYRLRQSMPTVAVLTGPMTGSSGEVVTVAFRNRPNTRSFGEPTAGLSTGNQNFRLRDGAQIFLTTSIYADRVKTVYGKKIDPDEPTSPATGGIDPALEAAKRWLGSRGK